MPAGRIICKLFQSRCQAAPGAAMYQDRQAPPVVPSGRKCGRTLLDPLANRLLERTNAAESGLDHSFAIIGHED